MQYIFRILKAPAMRKVLFCLINILIVNLVVSEEKNNVLCDNQLKYFREALHKHELWALTCIKRIS